MNPKSSVDKPIPVVAVAPSPSPPPDEFITDLTNRIKVAFSLRYNPEIGEKIADVFSKFIENDSFDEESIRLDFEDMDDSAIYDELCQEIADETVISKYIYQIIQQLLSSSHHLSPYDLRLNITSLDKDEAKTMFSKEEMKNQIDDKNAIISKAVEIKSNKCILSHVVDYYMCQKMDNYYYGGMDNNKTQEYKDANIFFKTHYDYFDNLLKRYEKYSENINALRTQCDVYTSRYFKAFNWIPENSTRTVFLDNYKDFVIYTVAFAKFIESIAGLGEQELEAYLPAQFDLWIIPQAVQPNNENLSEVCKSEPSELDYVPAMVDPDLTDNDDSDDSDDNDDDEIDDNKDHKEKENDDDDDDFDFFLKDDNYIFSIGDKLKNHGIDFSSDEVEEMNITCIRRKFKELYNKVNSQNQDLQRSERMVFIVDRRDQTNILVQTYEYSLKNEEQKDNFIFKKQSPYSLNKYSLNKMGKDLIYCFKPKTHNKLCKNCDYIPESLHNNALNYLLQLKDNKHIGGISNCHGYMMCLSYHLYDVNNVRGYFYTSGGHGNRLRMSDIVHYWPRLFVKVRESEHSTKTKYQSVSPQEFNVFPYHLQDADFESFVAQTT